MKNNVHPIPRFSAFRRVAALVAAGLLAHAALAQSSTSEGRDLRRDVDRERTVQSTAPGEKVKLRNPDKAFVEHVSRASLEAAEISRVAAERTSSPRVRALAESIASGHAAIGRELNAIAADKGVVLPAKDRIGEKWMKRDAKSFDVDYLGKMLSEHEETLKHFQKQAREGHDAELVSFARKQLATLQHHLQEASDLHRLMK